VNYEYHVEQYSDNIYVMEGDGAQSDNGTGSTFPWVTLEGLGLEIKQYTELQIENEGVLIKNYCKLFRFRS